MRQVLLNSKLLNATRTLSTDVVNFDHLLNLVDKATTKSKSNSNDYLIRVLGNGNLGSPKSFMLYAGDRERYLFNCGESTSRILSELNAMRDLKSVDVLLTRPTWTHCFSGIFGLIYTLTTLGQCLSIRFHAPFDTPKLLFDVYRLLKLKSIRFDRHDYESQGTFHSNNLTIERLQLGSIYGYYLTLTRSDTDSSKILVIDIPNQSVLNEFISSKLSVDNRRIDLLVHLSPSEILYDTNYVNYIKKISNELTKHLVFDENVNNIVSKQIYVHQTFLNELNEFIFPILPLTNKKKNIFNDQIDAKSSRIVNLSNAKLVNTYVHWDNIDDLGTQVMHDYPNYKKILSLYKPSSNKSRSIYPEMVFLGTSSSSPTSIRNVSSILLRVTDSRSILMDCGEGSLGQLAKFYGNGNYESELVNVKAIFLSHFHADHHTGLFEFVTARRRAFDALRLHYEPVFVLMPNNLLSFFSSINMFSDQYRFIDSVRIIDNEELLIENQNNEKIRFLKQSIGVNSIETVPVRHVLNSTGIIITTKSSQRNDEAVKVVYSGDSSPPSDELIRRGAHCHVLIHEATFGDSRVASAESCMHSTVRQAIETGAHMNAQCVVLTHFGAQLSTNSDHLYKWSSRSQPGTNVLVAHDFMRLNRSMIGALKLLTPALKLLHPTTTSSIRADLFI